MRCVPTTKCIDKRMSHKLITWNIRQGGGRRAAAIMDQLAQRGADAVALTEFREGKTGDVIRKGLTRLGLEHQAAPEVPRGTNSVIFASREPFDILPTDGLPPEDRHRCVHTRWCGMSVAALYFPQGNAKAGLFEFILSWPRAQLSEQSLLIGDFNTGKHGIDEKGATFHVAHYMDRLESVGWIDAWRMCHGSRREYTWYSNIGNGFRIDHMFVSPPLRMNVTAVDYIHHVRDRRLSDHSLMEMRLRGTGD